MQAAFKLVTTGGLRLIDLSGRDVAFPEKGLLAICLLLDCPDFSRSREQLARFLWSDIPTGVAHSNLRKMISRIRQRQAALGAEILAIDANRVALRPEGFIADFDPIDRNALDPGLWLERTCELLSGEYLANIETGSTVAREWINKRRLWHAERLRDDFLERLPQARASGQTTLIKQVALLLLERNPRDAEVRSVLIAARTGESEPNGRRASLPLVADMNARLNGQAAASSESILPKHHPAEEAGKPALRLPRLVLLPPPAEGLPSGLSMLGQELVEDVTILLCAAETVSVVAPYSASQISKNSSSDKVAAFERYAIDYVFDCRITDSGHGEPSIYAHLVTFANDEIIWAHRFPLEEWSLLDGRRAIVENLALSVAKGIDQNEGTRESFLSQPDAYRHFLFGQHHLKHIELRQVRRARKHFREALRECDVYAPALSGLARSYFMEWLLTARGDAELLRMAEQHAVRGIEAGEHLALAHRELGVIRLYQWAFDESLEALKRAENLSPQYANVIASYADTLVQASLPNQGLDKIERSIELNPLCPDDYLWTAAGASYSSGKYELALAYIGRMKDRSPADRLSAASWAMLGDLAKARQFVRRTRAVLPDFEVDKWLAIVPFREGWQKQHYREGLIKAGY